MSRFTHVAIASGLVLLVSTCSSIRPTAAPTDEAGAPSLRPAPSGWAGTPCTAFIQVTGDVAGVLEGPVPSQVRRLGDGSRGVSIDTLLDLAVRGEPFTATFSVFDADGPDGPEPVQLLLFGGTGDDLMSRGWQQGAATGNAALAEDGSSASFDADLSGGVGPPVRVTGSLGCELSSR